jgi:hypothetical protein
MPLSTLSRIRTDGPYIPYGNSTVNAYVPFYAVLFWYGNDIDFTNTPSGTLNVDYYRQYQEIYYPYAAFYNKDGSFNQQTNNPMICCISANSGWDSNTGLCTVATTNMPVSGATGYVANTHNPATIPRTAVFNTFGYAQGDALSPNVTFIDQHGDATHTHFANNIASQLTNLLYGTDNNGNVFGMNSIQVNPILRDPTLTTTGLTYNDTKLTYFPKNILVFGNNLPSPYYSQNDTSHIINANGYVLPIIASSVSGLLGTSNSLVLTVQTNTVLNHDHNTIPVKSQPVSAKANQLGYVLLPAGVHSHSVSYSCNVAIQSKILKAYITTSNTTPIANGVIIAYSVGRASTLFAGLATAGSELPLHWHFCDGTKGTPDLRGYYIYANLDPANTYHNVVNGTSNSLYISSITMAANGAHSHLGPTTGQALGTGAVVDIGSHGYEPALDHTHTLLAGSTFSPYGSGTTPVTNILPGQSYSYTPPTVQLAFIQYNSNIP